MPADATPLASLLKGFSIEVTPRTLAQAGDLRALLPAGTTVFIAHIAGTPIAQMVQAAGALRAQGFEPQPHIPARLLHDRAELADWLARYRDAAGVRRALLLAGGVAAPAGSFADSMQLVETGLFDAMDFAGLSFAGHPEGSPDIAPEALEAALRWKQALVQRTAAQVELVTQFAFEAAPILSWAEQIAAAGIDLPLRVGLAGPAKLQTLLRYGLSCGVGASLKVLQRRAGDLGRLLRPITPDAVAADLAQAPGRIAALHLFPLGGIAAAAEWARAARG